MFYCVVSVCFHLIFYAEPVKLIFNINETDVKPLRLFKYRHLTHRPSQRWWLVLCVDVFVCSYVWKSLSVRPLNSNNSCHDSLTKQNPVFCIYVCHFMFSFVRSMAFWQWTSALSYWNSCSLSSWNAHLEVRDCFPSPHHAAPPVSDSAWVVCPLACTHSFTHSLTHSLTFLFVGLDPQCGPAKKRKANGNTISLDIFTYILKCRHML